MYGLNGNQHLQQKPEGTLIACLQEDPAWLSKHLKHKPIVWWHCADPCMVTSVPLTNA